MIETISQTCIAPINIAVIKYWGKSDEDLIIPLNDSISVTLDTNYMFTKTTASANPSFTEDTIILNNEEGSKDNIRFKNCLLEVRKLAAASKNTQTVEKSKWKVAIVSENNFPTKAGLASSASGYACLVFTLAKLYGLDTNSSELSALARRGSGSACRSMFGGFVRWHKEEPCIAKPVAPADHWPELCCLVAVVSNRSKTVGSTEGMKRSSDTSLLLQHRVKNVVSHRIKTMEEAILQKDFVKFAELTMQDSNQFHAVCLDTYPPLFYMNSTSQAIIQLVHHYNKISQQVKVAYTFDAGPNAVLFMEKSELGQFGALLHSIFSAVPADEFFKGSTFPLEQVKDQFLGLTSYESTKGNVQYVISCSVGEGPKLAGSSHKQS